MSNINGVQQAAVTPVQPVSQAYGNAATSAPQAVGDTIEISTVARLASRVHELPDVRTELVERVKAEISAGTYETSDRLDVALERLMEELTGSM